MKSREDRSALVAFFDSQFGDPVQIALGHPMQPTGRPEAERFETLLAQALELIAEERFLKLGSCVFRVFGRTGKGTTLAGGFDAIVGNPPWDRMKLQQVEWFAARRPEIALATRASDRSRLIRDLSVQNDPLAPGLREGR